MRRECVVRKWRKRQNDVNRIFYTMVNSILNVVNFLNVAEVVRMWWRMWWMRWECGKNGVRMWWMWSANVVNFATLFGVFLYFSCRKASPNNGVRITHHQRVPKLSVLSAPILSLPSVHSLYIYSGSHRHQPRCFLPVRSNSVLLIQFWRTTVLEKVRKIWERKTIVKPFFT